MHELWQIYIKNKGQCKVNIAFTKCETFSLNFSTRNFLLSGMGLDLMRYINLFNPISSIQIFHVNFSPFVCLQNRKRKTSMYFRNFLLEILLLTQL